MVPQRTQIPPVSVDYGLVQVAFQPLIGETFTPTSAALETLVVLAIQAALILISTRVTTRLNNSAVATEVIGIVGLTVLLVIVAAVRGLGHWSNLTSTGVVPHAGYYAWLGPFMLATLLGAYTIVGFEAASNLAEETHEPHKVIPKAMIRAVLVSGIVGFAFLIALTYSISSVKAATASSAPVAFIVHNVLGGVVQKIFLILVCVSIFACGLVIMVTNSRLIFAMARDKRLPGHQLLSQVPRATGGPSWATILAAVVGAIITLVLRTHAGALATLFTASTIMPALLYAATVILYVVVGRRRRGRRGGEVHSTLGRWEIPVVVGALIWLAYELIVLIGPSQFRDAQYYVLGSLGLGLIVYAVGIPVERTGALLAAWNDEEQAALPGIEDKARRNGYTAIRRVSAAELYRREPHLAPGAACALEIPDESIICPWTTPLAYATEAVRAGVRLLLGHRVTAVTSVPEAAGEYAGEHAGEYQLTLAAGAPETGTLRCRWVVNAAGLHSDTIDRMFGLEGFTIQPRRGELIVLDKLARPLLGSILLPVPTARTKGVLVAPTVYGNVLVGPTADDIEDRSDVATTATGLIAVLAAGHRIVPSLAREEVTATYAGLRAATEHRDYQIHIDAARRYARVAGIRSTGLSASLGIAEYVAAQLGDAGLPLVARAVPGPPVMPYIGEAGVRPYQDPARIAADPQYGQIVCHCERVSRGEIRDALASVIPPADLSGLSRRTRVLNGRCQGFYCGAAISRLLAAHLSRPSGQAARELSAVPAQGPA